MNTHPNTLVHLLKLFAQNKPAALAIIAPNVSPLTYFNLLTLIEQVHNSLSTFGLSRHSRIASVLPNIPEAATAFLAISAGCTFAPINPSYTKDEFEFYLSSLNVDALITLEGFDSPVRQVAKKLHIPLLECVPVPEKGAGYFYLIGKTGLTTGHFDYATALDTLMLLNTSGSTGAPKIVPIQQQAFCYTLAANSIHRNLNSKDRCLNVLPLFHLQGLLVVAYPLSAGGSCVYAGSFEPERFIAYLKEFDPSFYVGTPIIHQSILKKALQTDNFHKNPSLRFFSSSAAPLPITDIQALESLFGVPLIESYGMTETLTISSNPLPPMVRKPGSVGKAVDNQITIVNVDDIHQVFPVDAIGEIVVQSPWLMAGYINNDQANKSAFCTKGFRTGDLGYFDEEGYLFITGRVKEIINRGGEKISPLEVDHVLLTHPAIKEALCFPVPHPTLGENIAAIVVTEDNVRIDPETLRQFVRQKLAEFKVPYRILIEDHLPKGLTGKIQRHTMASYFVERLAIHDNKVNERDVVLTSLQKSLLIIWKSILKNKVISIHDNFFELGGDSLRVIEICQIVALQLGREIPVRLFFKTPTIVAIAQFLEGEKTLASAMQITNYLVQLQQGHSNKPLLVIIPGGLGSDNEILVFAKLTQLLPTDLTVLCFNMRMLDSKITIPSKINKIASLFLKELLAHAQGRPFHLLGECLAAGLAYEMAQQATRSNQKLKSLILLDPQYPTREKFLDFLWRGRRIIYQYGLIQFRHRVKHLLVRVSERTGHFNEYNYWQHRYRMNQYNPEPLSMALNLILSQDESTFSSNWTNCTSLVNSYCVHGSHDSYIREMAQETAAVITEILSRSKSIDSLDTK